MKRTSRIGNFLAGIAVGIGLTSLTMVAAQNGGISGGSPQPPCTADIAPAGGNNIVNVDDLLAVINQWGPCPCVGGCDDGNPCTTDTCVNGVCQHTPVTSGCCVTPCTLTPHATSVICSDNKCFITGCQTGWHDCDGIYANGCETFGICP